MEKIQLEWSDFKTDIIAKKFPTNFRKTISEGFSGYEVFAVDRAILWFSNIVNSTDKTDFETNYKANCNLYAPQVDGDGKAYVRSEVRPINKTGYFSGSGDDVQNVIIGGGSQIDWDFSNSDDQTTIDANWKKKTIDVQFTDTINIRGGFLSYRESQNGCILDAHVVCPDGQYYLTNAGTPQQASGDVVVNTYLMKFAMDGDNPSGLLIDSDTSSPDIPSNYKLRFVVTTKTADVTSRGHIALFLYRSKTVAL